MNEIIFLTIPCYNEEAVLNETAAELKKILTDMVRSGKISEKSRIVFINDGSNDRTWEIIKNLHQEDTLFTGICLSRNRGHQNAVLAGYMYARELADACISLDADLQDDVGTINKFIDEFQNGYDIVYGVRSSRTKDTFFKRFSAESFYRFMAAMGVEIIFNHADFRLLSRRALDGLAEFDETNLFLRGIVPQIGYPSTKVEYERHERFAGKSKYPLKKMLALAFDGITSFSIKPLQMITNMGIILLAVCFVMFIYAIVSKITGHVVAGWTSLMLSIWMIGGIQLLSLGMIGEYIGKVYSETKKRPHYIIQEILDDSCIK